MVSLPKGSAPTTALELPSLLFTLQEARSPSGAPMFVYPKEYDVLVIGAGHAGVEAALAAARLGCEVAVLTQNLDTLAR